MENQMIHHCVTSLRLSFALPPYLEGTFEYRLAAYGNVVASEVIKVN